MVRTTRLSSLLSATFIVLNFVGFDTEIGLPINTMAESTYLAK